MIYGMECVYRRRSKRKSGLPRRRSGQFRFAMCLRRGTSFVWRNSNLSDVACSKTLLACCAQRNINKLILHCLVYSCVRSRLQYEKNCQCKLNQPQSATNQNCYGRYERWEKVDYRLLHSSFHGMRIEFIRLVGYNLIIISSPHHGERQKFLLQG